MLKIKNLSLVKKKKSILSQIDMQIPRQAITLLLGKSGSGKTSLLRCLAQLESRYEGELFFCEEALRDLPPKKRCKLIGFVSQAYALFPHMSALDNCIHPLRNSYGCTFDEAEKKSKKPFCLFGHRTTGLCLSS